VSLWAALIKGVDEARESMRASGTAMPWEQAEEITVISWADFQEAVGDSLNAVIIETGERRRLAAVGIKAAEEATAKGIGITRPLKAGRYGIRHCARCGNPFTPRVKTATYCCPACRVAMYKRRKAAQVIAGAEEP
jgi:NADH pyrophosphatase NudC (nudix superfamily)